LAPRARCWLMVTLSSPSTPSPSLQSCSPAAQPQPVLVPGVVPPQVQDPALALAEPHQVPLCPTFGGLSLFPESGSWPHTLPLLPPQHHASHHGKGQGTHGRRVVRGSCPLAPHQPKSTGGDGSGAEAPPFPRGHTQNGGTKQHRFIVQTQPPNA